VPRSRLPALPLPLLLLLLAACGGSAPSGPPPVASDAPVVAVPSGSFTAVVQRVVDGDTFLARVGGAGPAVRVRLLGVDTPETVKPNTPVACFGHAASALTTRLITGVRVTAAFESEHTDAYQRQLWDVWLPDGRFLAGLLAASGTSRILPYRPNIEHASELAAAESLARRERRGLWRACAETDAFPQLRGKR